MILTFCFQLFLVNSTARGTLSSLYTSIKYDKVGPNVANNVGIDKQKVLSKSLKLYVSSYFKGGHE